MASGRLPKSDSNIISTAEDLHRIDQSYREYDYQRVTPQEGAPSNWAPGSNLTYNLPQYNDSMYDGRDFLVDGVARFEVDFTPAVGTKIGVKQTIPLHAYHTCAPEEFFFSGLLENLEAYYGGVKINGVSAPSNLFPTAHSVYTMLTEDAAQYHGSAEIRNLAYIVDNDESRLIDNRPMVDVKSDSKNPYNMTLCYDKLGDPSISSVWPFAWQDGTTKELNPNNEYNSTQKYLQQLISNDSNYNPSGPGTDLLNGANVKAYKVHFTAKLKLPMLDSKYKYPANSPMRIVMRRSKDPKFYLSGYSDLDAWLSTGTDGGALATITGTPLNNTNFTNSTYKVTFETLDLYAKRLVMTDSQREILYSVPSLQYDLQHYQAQTHNLTGDNITFTFNFESRPTLALVALVPAASINVPSYTKFEKRVSNFHTSPNSEIGFTRIKMNTNLGQIPENEYIFVDGDIPDPQQSGRAYEQFKKVCRNQLSVVPYQAWTENYQWIPFVINGDDSNPAYNATPVDRTSISLSAAIYRAPNVELLDHVLVVIGVCQNVLSVTNFSNIVVNV